MDAEVKSIKFSFNNSPYSLELGYQEDIPVFGKVSNGQTTYSLIFSKKSWFPEIKSLMKIIEGYDKFNLNLITVKKLRDQLKSLEMDHSTLITSAYNFL